MATKANLPKLFKMEVDYDRNDNGLWHQFQIFNSGNPKAIKQEMALESARPLAKTWQPLEVAVERFKETGDLSKLGLTAFVVGPKAARAFRPLADGNFEFLPITVVGEGDESDRYKTPKRGLFTERYPPILVLHPIAEVSLAPNADTEYFGPQGAKEVIGQIHRYAFHLSDLQRKHVFRIRGDFDYIVSDDFRKRALKAGLKGACFSPIKFEIGREVLAEPKSNQQPKPQQVKVALPKPINFKAIMRNPKMSDSLWEQWTAHWKWIDKAVKARGGESQTPRIGRPTTVSQVKSLQKKAGAALSTDFVDVVTNYAAKVSIWWDLSEPMDFLGGLVRGKKERLESSDLPPKAYDETRAHSGDYLWDFGKLLALKRDCDKIVKMFSARMDKYHKAFLDKWPFILVPNGDWIAFDISGSPKSCPIHYLSHDGDVSLHNRRLGETFIDFISRWSNVGCPGPELWEMEAFYDKHARRLASSGPRVDRWKSWLSGTK